MTREYAIRWLSKKLKVARQNAKDCETEWFATKSMYHTAVTVYEMAIAALREQEALEKKTSDSKTSDKKTSDWISVEERLPERGQSVLILCKNKAMFTGYQLPDYSGEARWRVRTALNSTKLLNKGRVTHWMPLPEPPKEEI